MARNNRPWLNRTYLTKMYLKIRFGLTDQIIMLSDRILVRDRFVTMEYKINRSIVVKNIGCFICHKLVGLLCEIYV